MLGIVVMAIAEAIGRRISSSNDACSMQEDESVLGGSELLIIDASLAKSKRIEWGIKCLTMEESKKLGFPSIAFEMELSRRRGNDSVSAGIRQFHQGKHFDLHSQDVALDL
ncbi:hypothetical protein B0H10DRAFT_2184752, partial [Mycena sp. CBHHK59/15]